MKTLPLCHHIMPNGNTCGSPALRNQRFCYFHSEQQKRAIRSKRAQQPSHACPFHPNVAIRRKKCPLFLAASQVSNSVLVNFQPSLIQPAHSVQLKTGNLNQG